MLLVPFTVGVRHDDNDRHAAYREFKRLSRRHDSLGRDLYVRTMIGGRISYGWCDGRIRSGN
ncbi:hypothetical protein O9993_14080 [Vibrio lentus]|nr:hypothetical protein [Vibrio lentus]